ncbi:isatin hydrolase-like [Tubulanus polymorphus]|uniref:isatin hydrolase-like n=1 Tax=Tubulanus polymorphus TaxID=672921 RepID=UPI003DA4B156
MKAFFILLHVIQIAYLSSARPITSDDVIDLTHVLDERAIGWPGNKPYILTEFKGPKTVNGVNLTWVEVGFLSTAEHIGTHMDAPSHFSKGNWKINDIPPERLIGPAVKVSIRDQASKDRDYVLSIQDILNWESVNGRIPNKAILFVDSGFAKFYPDRIKYSGAEQVVDKDLNLILHYPGISGEAAQFLVDERDIVGVVMDTISFDSGQNSKLFPAHHVLLGAKIWGVENCADMEKMPATGTIATVYPTKKRGSGSATRILVMKTDISISGSFKMFASTTFTVTALSVVLAIIEYSRLI